METDTSRLLYDYYFSREQGLIELQLKSGRKISGFFIGFCNGEEDFGDFFVTKWHLVPEAFRKSCGIDFSGFLTGDLINHEDIETVRFCDDGNTLKC